MARIPDGKTVAVDGGALVRVCPECGEHIELRQIVSDVYEVIDKASGVPRTVHVPEGSGPPDGSHGASLQTGEALAPARRGEHTDYDDAAYLRHYRETH